MNSLEPSGSSPPGDPFQDDSERSVTSTRSSKKNPKSRRVSVGSKVPSFKRTVAGTKSALRQRTGSLTSRSFTPTKRRPSRHAKFEDNEKNEDGDDENAEHSPRDELRAGLEHHLPNKLSFKQRMAHFTWTWFTMTMATGGIANVLYSIPSDLRFDSLYALGCTFFLFNIVLFFFNVVMISTRFYLHPHTFRQSFLHPTESLFIPAAVISVGTILINITQYGVGYAGDWLERAIVPLYWIYCTLSVLSSWGIFLTM
jgi:hypothetical protein